MTKPVREIDITTIGGKKGHVEALIDTGSFYTLIREDCLPKGASPEAMEKPEILGTAQKKGKVRTVGGIIMVMIVEGHPIRDEVYISPDLKREFIIGAKTMQAWDITIKNKNGHTTVHVGRDMNDPDTQSVE